MLHLDIRKGFFQMSVLHLEVQKGFQMSVLHLNIQKGFQMLVLHLDVRKGYQMSELCRREIINNPFSLHLFYLAKTAFVHSLSICSTWQKHLTSIYSTLALHGENSLRPFTLHLLYLAKTSDIRSHYMEKTAFFHSHSNCSSWLNCDLRKVPCYILCPFTLRLLYLVKRSEDHLASICSTWQKHPCYIPCPFTLHGENILRPSFLHLTYMEKTSDIRRDLTGCLY